MPVAGLCISLFAIKSLFCLADSTPGKPTDRWIEKTDHMITLKLTQSSDVEKLAALTDGKDVYLSPNVATVSQLSFSYRFITANLNFVPRFVGGNNDDDIKGKTTGRGFGLNFNFNHWQQELSYNRIRGFYLENTKDYLPSWQEGMPYIQFPKLVYSNFQGITAYSFNPRFSANAVTAQTERQIKSAGSFIPLLLYRYYITDDRSPGISSTQKSSSFEILAGAGYQYTFVFKQCYLSLGLTPAYGYVFTKLTTRSGTGNVITHNSTPAFRIDTRLGLGYNGRRFFAGTYVAAFGTANEEKNSTVINENTRGVAKVFIGYRLKAPRFLVKNLDKLDSLSRKALRKSH